MRGVDQLGLREVGRHARELSDARGRQERERLESLPVHAPQEVGRHVKQKMTEQPKVLSEHSLEVDGALNELWNFWSCYLRDIDEVMIIAQFKFSKGNLANCIY